MAKKVTPVKKSNKNVPITGYLFAVKKIVTDCDNGVCHTCHLFTNVGDARQWMKVDYAFECQKVQDTSDITKFNIGPLWASCIPEDGFGTEWIIEKVPVKADSTWSDPCIKTTYKKIIG